MGKADKTKERIIALAAPIFNKKGYAGTSVADIMAATGLAKGGLYGNFENKDEIAALVFEYSYNEVKAAITRRLKEEKTALGRLQALLEFYYNYTLNPSVEGGCPLLNTAIEADDAYPFLKERARQALKEMLSGLVRIIETGIDRGEFRAGIDARAEAVRIFAQIEGGIMMAKLLDDAHLLNQLLDQLKAGIEDNYPVAASGK